MNILFINATKSWGGIKTWMFQLADFLSQRGHNIVIVCRHYDPLIAECAARNLKCYPIHFGMDFSITTIWRFLKLFNAEQTEVVITNISKGVRTGGLAAKLKGLPHINRLGDVRDLKNTLKSKLIYSLLVDKVFVPSQSLFDHFGHYDFLQSKLRMFHNAVTPPPLTIPRNSPIKFAIVAKLSKRKQVDKVLLAFSRIKDLSWELFIGGFGPELEHLKKLTQDLKLNQYVHFAGKVEPYEFLKDKDVGILYSTREGFPYALVEYMASSCAVIASNIGGIPEIIEHQINGFLVDPHNIDDLEQAIRLLINDLQCREEFIRKGYDTVQNHFSQETIFSNIEQEIHQTIQRIRT
jgi:glycosyltransferase involved in cell wall biosynthesis